MPNGGWFGYTPLTEVLPGHNIDFWVFGLQILGIASLSGAVNLIVTVINMRAPGMSLMRMPVFVWMSLVAQFLLLFAIPIITVALFLLSFDRLFSTNFFVPAAGGDPLLWQHLFWLFGHPEVYILILPAMGIVSEILPVFSRKPLFGYAVMVFSGIAIGLMGWGVWVHHMFATGLGPVALSAFAASTMFIAVPTGVKIFNWISTMWGGKIKLTTPMLFAIGFVAMFTIGGLSGVTHAVVPSDTQQTDTYYIVAHFHYVLFGGSMFGLFGGAYYWWPKITGRMLNDKIGKVHFWLMFIGFNLTFGPFHVLGLQGMPRRIYTYPEGKGWDFWNFASTIGSFLIAISVLVFLYNVWHSRKNPHVGDDPWDARTPGVVDPLAAPGVQLRRDPAGHGPGRLLAPQVHRGRRGPSRPPGGPRLASCRGKEPAEHDEDADGVPSEDSAPDAPHAEEPPHIHMPSPSYWPAVTALALPIISYGMIYKAYVVAALGGVWILGCLFAWALEPATAPEDTNGHGDEHSPDDHDAPDEAVLTGRDPRARDGGPYVTTTGTHTDQESGGQDPGGQAEPSTPASAGSHGEMVHEGHPPTSTGLSQREAGDVGLPRLRVPALRRPDLHVPAVQGPERAGLDHPRRRVRHPLHVGQLVRPADEQPHHGAGPGRHPAGRPPPPAAVDAHAPPCSGATFVGGQAYEFTVFVREGLNLRTNLFGSTFYVLTGFHGAHVTIGVLMLLSLCVLSIKGRIPAERAEAVELVGLYWHFVDVVWIVIFTLVYLIP